MICTVPTIQQQKGWGLLCKCADPQRVAQQEDNPIAKRNSEDNWDYSPIDRLLPMDGWMMIIMHLMGLCNCSSHPHATHHPWDILVQSPKRRQSPSHWHSFVCAFPPAEGPCYIRLVTPPLSWGWLVLLCLCLSRVPLIHDMSCSI